MDKEVRNRIQKATQQARTLLEEEYRTQLEGTYDILPDGTIKDAPGAHLGEQERIVRHKLVQAVEHKRSNGMGPAESVDAFIREAAFTTLNRFVAVKMLEARDLLQECVSKGDNSSGFKEFSGLAPGLKELPDHGYRLYIECLFDELSQEIKVLFDRRDPVSLLWPRRQALHDLLEIINREELSSIWAEDETIGWVYQYFNSEEDRRSARYDSSGKPKAPQNSRELAVRNQFFTPRYVVEFLTDNTLGRIWYEMRKGQTFLKDTCQYLVLRPNEIFLAPGEKVPEDERDMTELSQEELLQEPVYIEHRPQKDPRDLKVLDPACGSGHFLLYAFDVLVQVYEEAWKSDESPKSDVTGKTIKEDFTSLDELSKHVPKMIVEHNLHGIDIDSRAVQIANLTLWLRAQKKWKALGLKTIQRPKVSKSNVVTAEPMPGDDALFQEFVKDLKPRVLQQLLKEIFDKMKLAGEAGALLKIEEEIKEAIAQARKQWLEMENSQEKYLLLPGIKDRKPKERQLKFDTSGITDEKFWEQAEDKILHKLTTYAEDTISKENIKQKLFSKDAEKGFSFIDLCRKQYDVITMNPPFGDPTYKSINYIISFYEIAKKNLYIAFIDRATKLCSEKGSVASITDRTFITHKRHKEFRKKFIYGQSTEWKLFQLIDHGWGILDSYVQTASYVLSRNNKDNRILCFDLKENSYPEAYLLENIKNIRFSICESNDRYYIQNINSLKNLPNGSLSFWMPNKVIDSFNHKSIDPVLVDCRSGLSSNNNERFYKLIWEVPRENIGKNKRWSFLANGGRPSPFFRNQIFVIDYGDDGRMVKELARTLYTSETRTIKNQEYYRRFGLTYGKRTENFNVQILPAEHLFSNEGHSLFSYNENNLLIACAYLNSTIVSYILNCISGLHKESGYVGSIPLPKNVFDNSDKYINISRYGYNIIAQCFSKVPESQFFTTPYVEDNVSKKSTEKLLQENEFQINEICDELDDLTFNLFNLKSHTKNKIGKRYWNINKIIYNENDFEKSFYIILNDLIGWLIGIIFGRWDIRLALDPSLVPKLPSPFEPLPINPPAMLVNTRGFPANSEDIVSQEWLNLRQDANQIPSVNNLSEYSISYYYYPLRITWSGILLDDEGHPEDITSRIKETIKTIWKDNANKVEHEVCQTFKINFLKDYLSDPSKFFAEHIKSYSQSSRKAPIYWQLATPSASYSVWLYYHRFDKDTFYRVLEYVKDKLKLEEWNLESLRHEFGPNPNADQRKKIENQEFFIRELRDFRDEVARITPLWKPNLNDGVIINFAPLWRLVAHYKPWQDQCKKVWDKLVNEGYDWAHLAMHLWPERVVPKCQKDQSLAIAHGLEDKFWYEDDKGKMQPREVSQEEFDALIKERTSAAVKSALQSLLDAPEMPTSGKKRKKKR